MVSQTNNSNVGGGGPSEPANFPRGGSPSKSEMQLSTTGASPSNPGDVSHTPPQETPSRSRSTDDTDVNSSISADEENRWASEVQNYPDGWARIAAEQNHRHNGSFFPRFGYGHQRLIAYLGGRIINLEKQLAKLDKESSAHLKCWSAWQKHEVGEECLPDKLDLIMEELINTKLFYGKLLLRDKKLQGLEKPTSTEVIGFRNELKKRRLLDEESLSYLESPDDFVCTRPKQLHMPLFYWLCSNRLGQTVIKLVFGRETEESEVWRVPASTVRRINVATTIICVITLLVPIVVLYLCDLTKAESLVVVVICTAFFGGLMTMLKDVETKLGYVLIAVSAYAALLVTFLAQLLSVK